MTDIPTYVVIPVIEHPAEPIWFEGAQSVTVIPNGAEGPELNLSAKWNSGMDWAAKQARMRGASAWNVAILNDDIETAPDFLGQLAAGLRRKYNTGIRCGRPENAQLPLPTPTIAYANCHGAEQDSVYSSDSYAGQTMAGWAFMLRGELGLRFDEQFRYWYGDSDLEKQVVSRGGVAVCVAKAHANHLRPMEATRRSKVLLQIAKDDEARFAVKYGLDPSSLWLAQHPEFGSEAT